MVALDDLLAVDKVRLRLADPPAKISSADEALSRRDLGLERTLPLGVEGRF